MTANEEAKVLYAHRQRNALKLIADQDKAIEGVDKFDQWDRMLSGACYSSTGIAGWDHDKLKRINEEFFVKGADKSDECRQFFVSNPSALVYRIEPITLWDQFCLTCWVRRRVSIEANGGDAQVDGLPWTDRVPCWWRAYKTLELGGYRHLGWGPNPQHLQCLVLDRDAMDLPLKLVGVDLTCPCIWCHRFKASGFPNGDFCNLRIGAEGPARGLNGRLTYPCEDPLSFNHDDNVPCGGFIEATPDPDNNAYSLRVEPFIWSAGWSQPDKINRDYPIKRLEAITPPIKTQTQTTMSAFMQRMKPEVIDLVSDTD